MREVSQSYKFNILFLIVSVLWPLIRAQYLGGIDGAGRLQQIFMLLAIIVNGKDLFKVPGAIWVWCIWIIYSVINTQIKGFYADNLSYSIFVVNHLIYPFITLLVSYKVCLERFEKTFEILFFTYVFYDIIGSMGMTISNESYDVATRMRNEMGNEFFNTAILLALFSSLMYQLGKLGKMPFYLLLLLITYVIVISGERKGLIALLIMILGTLYSVNMGKGGKSLIYMIVTLSIVVLGINYIMKYASFGERMRDSFERTQFSDNLFLQLMGDRGIMYYDGWKMFLDNMWCGIGLTKFRWVNDFFYGLPLHTEYMVQLCECGIVGSILFLLFYNGMIKGLLELWKNGIAKEQTMIIASSLLAIIVVNFVSWSYDNVNYFSFFGLVFAFYTNKIQKYKEWNIIN